MASGAAAASFFNTYLLANFEALKSDAGAWLRQADPLETVENPTVYRGSTLRYTGAVEEVSRFIGVVPPRRRRWRGRMARLWIGSD